MRLFVAIDLPEELKEYFSQVQNQIGEDSAQLSYVQKENLHITLKFLGEVKEENIKKIKEILGNIKFRPFSLVTEKMGIFPDENYIRVVWIGFKGEDILFELHKSIDISLSRMFREGPEVSLNGSPTVSPTTAALCASEPFPPN